jgi:hypothetical protein
VSRGRSEPVLLVLAGCWIDYEKSTSARPLAHSLSNENIQLALCRETFSTTPL